MIRILLASKSPRRQELLTKLGYDYEVIKSNYDESELAPMQPIQYCSQLSINKAKFATRSDGIVLSADTIVVLGNEILGKPADIATAYNMYDKLLGRWHEVITAFTLRVDELYTTKYEITRVKINNYNQEVIDDYILSAKAMDKAGAYGLQDLEQSLNITILGDRDNVIGLPTKLLKDTLDEITYKNI